MSPPAASEPAVAVPPVAPTSATHAPQRSTAAGLPLRSADGAVHGARPPKNKDLEARLRNVVALHCQGKADVAGVLAALAECGASVTEYNRVVCRLATVRRPTRSRVLRTQLFVDMPFCRELLQQRQRMHEDSAAISQQRLDRFYSVRNCPSFLLNGAMLSEADIGRFVQIYAGLSALSPAVDPAIPRFLHEQLHGYVAALTAKAGEGGLTPADVTEFIAARLRNPRALGDVPARKRPGGATGAEILEVAEPSVSVAAADNNGVSGAVRPVDKSADGNYSSGGNDGRDI